MGHSSILGGETAASHATGKDIDSLGPSDSSDSGSDVQGERVMPTRADNPGELGAVPADGDSDSDALGTGERGSAEGNDGPAGADILPDRIVSASEAGVSPRRDGDDVEQLVDDDGDDESDDEAGDPPDDPSGTSDDPHQAAAERTEQRANRTREVLGATRPV